MDTIDRVLAKSGMIRQTIGELTVDDLDAVTGADVTNGITATVSWVQGEIVSPRDPASGLPTRK